MNRSFYAVRIWFVMAVVLVLGNQASFAQTVVPEDFAFGLPIDTVGGQPIQSVVIPEAVYGHATLADLVDLRVFNAENAPVPHAIHKPAERLQAREASHNLAIFPILGRPEDALSALNVQVRKNPSGTLIQVDDRPNRGTAALRAYLVDASQLDVALNELIFHWENTPQDLLIRITVESSDDLVTWNAWGAPGTLASMAHENQVLLRNTLKRPARKARYYRISWPASTTLPAVSRLEGLSVASRPDAERYWKSYALTAGDDGVFTTELSAAIPFDRVMVDLPESQRIVRVRLTSSMEPDGPEIQHYQGLAYRLNAGEDSWESPAISVTSRTHKYWKLTVLNGQAPLLGGAPSLRIGWTPGRVLFVPQGDGPFTLAYGNAEAEPAAFTSQELFLPIQHDFDDVYDVPLASAGTPAALGGAERLERADEIPWERLVLWGSLVVGVVLLTVLSVRLLRNVDNTKQDNADQSD